MNAVQTSVEKGQFVRLQQPSGAPYENQWEQEYHENRYAYLTGTESDGSIVGIDLADMCVRTFPAIVIGAAEVCESVPTSVVHRMLLAVSDAGGLPGWTPSNAFEDLAALVSESLEVVSPETAEAV